MVILETPRLLFRRLTVDDVDNIAVLYSDPAVMRFFDGPRTRQQAAEQIEKYLRMYDEYGYYFWATIHKSDNSFIGRCGLLPQIVEGQPEVEVAYMLAKEYWNHGLATEAARAIKEYGFEKYQLPRLISLI